MSRTFLWINAITATLVVVGIFVQVYLIAAYIFGAGGDALSAHKDLGNTVHGVEVLVFLSALGAYWRRWWEVGLSFALAVIGTAQVFLANGDRWVGALHGLFALLVFVLGAVVAHRSARALGLGRRGSPGPA